MTQRAIVNIEGRDGIRRVEVIDAVIDRAKRARDEAGVA